MILGLLVDLKIAHQLMRQIDLQVQLSFSLAFHPIWSLTKGSKSFRIRIIQTSTKLDHKQVIEPLDEFKSKLLQWTFKSLSICLEFEQERRESNAFEIKRINSRDLIQSRRTFLLQESSGIWPGTAGFGAFIGAYAQLINYWSPRSAHTLSRLIIDF